LCAKKIPISSYLSTKELVISTCSRGVVGVCEGGEETGSLFSLLSSVQSAKKVLLVHQNIHFHTFMNYRLLSSGGGGVHQANQL